MPTTEEAGLPQFQVSAWNTLFAQRNLPTEIQGKLTGALAKALDDASIHKRLTALGCVIPDKAERTPRRPTNPPRNGSAALVVSAKGRRRDIQLRKLRFMPDVSRSRPAGCLATSR